MTRSPRQGFTLIELMVVVTVIGLIVALLLPAVQAAREAARRVQCASHLKSLGVALHLHEETLGRFPAGMIERPWLGSFLFQSLPFLEQQALYDSINVSQSVFDFVQSTAVRQVPAVLLCPSDSSRGGNGSEYGVNYAGEADTVGRFPSNLWDGVFQGRPMAPRDLTDGLSWTVGVEEWVVGSGDLVGQTRLGTPFRFVKPFGPGPAGAEAFLRACLDLSPPVAPQRAVPILPGYKGALWLSGELGFTLYTHALPPDSPSCEGGLGGIAYSAGSFHPGGGHVMMMDGAVRFVQTSVASAVWRAIGTRAGGELVAQDAY